MPSRFSKLLRAVLLGSRWGMAPFCLGLIIALLVVLVQFLRELVDAVANFAGLGGSEVILAVLKLVDLVLVANLVLMMIGAAVEIFAPAASEGEERRSGLASIADFAALKPKLFASISAIAAIDLLESFINIEPAKKQDVLWEIAMLLAFVVSGVLLAWMDRLTDERH